jgi:hypothetical protein
MYHDSPESRDVPPQARTRGPSPVRASLAGGLVGGIGVMVVLIVTGVVAIPGGSRKAEQVAAVDTTVTTITGTDTVASPVVVATTDTVVTTTTITPMDTVQGTATAPVVTRRQVEVEDPPTPTPEQRVRMYRGALQEAILRADQAEIDAQRQLDTSPLYAAYTGQMLQNALSSVQSLRDQDLHMDSRLLNVEWHSFWVSPDERTARVETTETWYSEYHRNGSDECVAVSPEHDVPQRATLRREEGVCKVASVTFTGASHEPQACP